MTMLTLRTQRYWNVEFLQPLIDAMTRDAPSERCDAVEAEELWRRILATRVSFLHLPWRLRERNQNWADAIVGDGVSLVDYTFQLGKSLFGWLAELSG